MSSIAIVVKACARSIHKSTIQIMQLPKRATGSDMPLVESTGTRITVICMCLFFLFLIALGQGKYSCNYTRWLRNWQCKGLRYGRMTGRRSWSKVLEALVLLQCVICVAYVSTVAILEAGLSMTNAFQCHLAIRSCITLYGCGKVSLWVDFNSRNFNEYGWLGL